MAQAKHTPAVTRTEVVEVIPATITLHLSIEEAQALLAVCKRIGGSSAFTRRKHFDSIQSALCSVGISESSSDFDPKLRAIYFTEPSL